VLVSALQILHALALYVFTEVPFPDAWAWLGFGMIYWLGTGLISLSVGWNNAKNRSGKVKNMYLMAIGALLVAQVVGDGSLALLYTKKFGILEYFLVLSVLDFVTRIALGVYFSLNVQEFQSLNFSITKSTNPTKID
jgi:uncharacterized membrane protein (DUF485 family)